MFALALLNDVPFFLDYPNLSRVLHSGSGGLQWELDLSGAVYAHSLTHARTYALIDLTHSFTPPLQASSSIRA